MILGFKGANRPFSNFWESPFVIDDIEYCNVEQWFVWNKTLIEAQRQKVLEITDPAKVKSFGRKSITLRADWELIKDAVMLEGLRAKFGQNRHLADLLCATGREYLEETNTWGDRYWGVDGTGLNRLGIYLMMVRCELQAVRG